MKTGWIKQFLDGTHEVGTNHDVQNKRASWSQGRLNSMFQAEIEQDNCVILIDGLGSYWQSDDYEVSLGETWPSMVTRRLQRQICQGDIFVDISNENQGKRLFACVGQVEGLSDKRVAGKRSLLTTKDIGKWLTLEIDLITKSTRYYISEHRI